MVFGLNGWRRGREALNDRIDVGPRLSDTKGHSGGPWKATDCIRQHARGSRCFTGRTNRDMSVIKPDAGDIKHRPFGTHL